MKRMILGVSLLSLVFLAGNAQAIVRSKFCGTVTSASAGLQGLGILPGAYFQGFLDVDETAIGAGGAPTSWTGPGLGTFLTVGGVTSIAADLDTVDEHAGTGAYDLTATIAPFMLGPLTLEGSASAGLTLSGNSEATPVPDSVTTNISGSASVTVDTVPPGGLGGPQSITASVTGLVNDGDANVPGVCVPPVPAVPVWGVWVLGGLLAGTSAAMFRMRKRA